MAQKRVLVTGSSRGIGRAIALRLAQDGWSIALHYTSHQEEAMQVAAELGTSASGVYQADLADPANAKVLWQLVTQGGPIDALVNNAGVYLPVDFLDTTDRDFEANLQHTMALNFESPALLMRSASVTFMQQGHGKVLNVTSRVGFRGEPGASTYAASKAALINLTRSLAVELANENIQVFGIAPGWVDTAMARNGMEERLPEILKTIPVGRMARPEDCGAAAAFLLSEEASYLSGVVIDINGASYFH